MADPAAPWDEKPEPVWVPRRYSSKSKIKEDDIPMLILEEMDAWLKKLKEHIEWQQSYIDANQLVVNQFAFHDEKYWWKGMDLDEMQRKADIFDEWEEGRCGYFKPSYGCDSPTGIGNSVMCRKLPNCEVLTEESLWKQVKAARDKLYEDLPTGDIDSFALLKVVQTHIATLDEVLEDL